MNPRFLTVEFVLRLHFEQIEEFGGAHGVRDQGLLESAVAAPMATFGGEFLHGDLYEMAAALCFSLVSNHPFVDGNKRIGAEAALVFLAVNGIKVPPKDPDSFEALILAVASGTAGKDEVAAYFRS